MANKQIKDEAVSEADDFLIRTISHNNVRSINDSTARLNKDAVRDILQEFYDLIEEKLPPIEYVSSPLQLFEAARKIDIKTKVTMPMRDTRPQFKLYIEHFTYQYMTDVNNKTRNAIQEQINARGIASLIGTLCAKEKIAPIDDIFYGQHDALWISFYEFLDKKLPADAYDSLPQGKRMNELHLRQAREMGFWIPFKSAVFVSEKVSVLKRDENMRYHCEDGPAVAWDDPRARGYFWKGIEVAKPEILTNPKYVTFDLWQRESNQEQRRIIMEKYVTMNGHDAFFKQAKGKIIHQDNTGKLWNVPSQGAALAFVEVQNGTVEKDGSRKQYYLQVPPQMRTAIDAVAWTYGMTSEQYKNLRMRT